ncbi:MAG: hypothetical protein ACYC27_04955 [Armatimonadota bacterium]
MRTASIILLAVLCFACHTQAFGQSAKSVKKPVWMIPPSAFDGKCFRELFQSPDQWKETRSHIDVLGYADHMLNRQFTDKELKTWFSMMNKWKLKFGLEVGAVKPWGTTGKATFDAQKPMWDRFISLGADIDTIALDEPLCCVRKDLKKPDSYAVEETAQFIALVRKNYPDMKIGDIEAYPFLSTKELLAWIDALQSRLKEMNVRGLDFFRVDVDWVHFIANTGGSWPDLKQLELGCRQRGIPFSLIYWAADYPALQAKGLAEDATWYISIMQQAYDYALVDGSPDEYVIESWIPAPSKSVPDKGGYTFTHSVLDFCRRFVR